jgi:hypothetical protein
MRSVGARGICTVAPRSLAEGLLLRFDAWYGCVAYYTRIHLWHQCCPQCAPHMVSRGNYGKGGSEVPRISKLCCNWKVRPFRFYLYESISRLTNGPRHHSSPQNHFPPFPFGKWGEQNRNNNIISQGGGNRSAVRNEVIIISRDSSRLFRGNFIYKGTTKKNIPLHR